jgi:antitoxin HicB
MKLDYPVDLARDTNGTILVTFPDVRAAVTFGEDRADALRHAVDVLDSALAIYIERRQPLPKPGARKGRATVRPSLQACMKIEIYNAMRAAGMRKAALARRLGWNPRQVDRLLDLNNATRPDHIEAALAALGLRPVFAVAAA